MEKRYAFLVSLLVVVVVAGNWLFFNSNEIFPEREIVIISRVIDGDTLELKDGRIVRLLNINTPERGKFWYDKATNFLRQYEGESVGLELEGKGKYGRDLGRIYYNKNYVNLKIVEEGYGHVYIFGNKEIGVFKKAEDIAREDELGIWEKSEYYDCLEVEINKYDEYVVVKDSCEVNFKGWTIKDESTKDFKFSSSEFSYFTLYSGEGVSKNEVLYWGRSEVWDDERDSVFIRDSDGLLVYYDSYGY